jgi:hypothetical protein
MYLKVIIHKKHDFSEKSINSRLFLRIMFDK